MTNALISVEEHRSVYIPTQADWNFMLQWGAQAIKSRMLPQSITSPEAAAIIVLKGRELGLSFMTSISHINVISGKPAMSAELIQGLARKNLPGLVINILCSNHEIAEIEFIRPEKGSKPYIQTFSIEDAKKAGLLEKQVWKQYPSAMLWSRCITAGLRKVCPEVLMGVSYTPEELGAETDSDGNVIETTSKSITTPPNEESKNSEIKELPKPVIEIPDELLMKRAEGQKIKLLRTELGINETELKQKVFELCQNDDFKTLTLEQMKQVTLMLELEKKLVDESTSSDAPWIQENMGQMR